LFLDLSVLAAVCRWWKQISRAENLWNAIDLSDTNFVTDEIAVTLIRRNPRARSLNLSNCVRLTGPASTQMRSHARCSFYTSAIFDEAVKRTDETAVAEVVRSVLAPSLEELRVAYTYLHKEIASIIPVFLPSPCVIGECDR
jgi:hypothetical protein